MKLIFCLDKSGGISLFGKRQSRDRLLCERLLALVNGARLWVSRYSAPLFSGYPALVTDDAYAAKAADGDFCFVEDCGYDIERADTVILCHWNRRYPGDLFFTPDLAALGFQRVMCEAFPGSSHDKITLEMYTRALT